MHSTCRHPARRRRELPPDAQRAKACLSDDRMNAQGSLLCGSSRLRSGAPLMSCCDKKSNFLKRSPNRRSISVLILGLFLILLLIALLGVPGSWLLRPLETRFPVRRQAPTDQVTGIVLLGGFHLDSRVASELNSHVASELDSRAASERFDIRSGIAERIMETVRLSKSYPEARILYSGGGMEAKLGKKVLMRLGH